MTTTPVRAPVASCVHCQRVVSVHESKFGRTKLRPHKDSRRQPCHPEDTASVDTSALRQADLRQRRLLSTTSQVDRA